jgi:hypothetical protein
MDNTHRLVAASLMFTICVAGCGGPASHPPTIANLSYSPKEISVGLKTTISGSFTFTDDDGDPQELAVALLPPTGPPQALPPTAIQGGSGQKAGTLTFAVILMPPVAGSYSLDLSLVDSTGASNHLTGALEAQ